MLTKAWAEAHIGQTGANRAAYDRRTAAGE
jgi:hypothetical protein